MPIAVVIALMGVMVALAGSRRSLGKKEYMIIFLITLAQVTVLLYVFFTMEQPPVY